MSKQKTVHNSFFKPDAVIMITGADLAILSSAIDDAVSAAHINSLPVYYRYIDKQGEPVEPENVTMAKLESGELRRVMDPVKTFREGNVIEAFNANHLSKSMLEAKRVVMDLLDNGVAAGDTVFMEEIQKEFEDKRAKAEAKKAKESKKVE